MMKKIVRYLTARLKEKSTWLGLLSFLTALGIVISPEQKEMVVTAGVALAGIGAVFIAEKENK